MTHQGEDQVSAPPRRPPLPSAVQVARNALQMARRGELEQATRVLQARLGQGSLAPGEVAELRLVLARVLLDEGRSKASVAELVEVLRVDAHRPDALLLLAEALIACEETERARDILGRARRSGADPQRLSTLEERLDDNNHTDHSFSTDSIPLLISDEGPLLEDDEFDQLHDTFDIPRQAGLSFGDEEQTVPWAGPDPFETRPPSLGGVPDSAYIDDPDLEDAWDMTEKLSVEDPEQGVPTAPLHGKLIFGPREGTDVNTTKPRAWSIGDPGRAGVSPRSGPLLAFDDDEDTVTGSFDGVSGALFKGLDKAVRRRLTQENQPIAGPGNNWDTGPNPDKTEPSRPADYLRSEAPTPLMTPSPRKPTLPSPMLADPDATESGGFQSPETLNPPTMPSVLVKIVEEEEPAQHPDGHRRHANGAIIESWPQGTAVPTNAPNTAPSPELRARRHKRPEPGDHIDTAPLPDRAKAPSATSVPSVATLPTPPQQLVAHAPQTSRSTAKQPLLTNEADPRPKLRQPDLLQKLEAAAKKQSQSDAELNARTSKSITNEDLSPRPKRRRLPFVITALLVTVLLIATISGMLFIYPGVHYRAVMTHIDGHLEEAQRQEELDTFQGYKLAAEHFDQATGGQGPAGATIGNLTDEYLIFAGVDAHIQRRQHAKARLAHVQAILETRYKTTATPNAGALLKDLKANNVHNAWAEAAAARLLIADGKADEAIGLIEKQGMLLGEPHKEHLIGMAHLSAKRPDKAREHFDKARRADAKHVPSRLALAAWFAQRQDPNALHHLNDILNRLSREHPEALIARSSYLVRSGERLDQAREDLQRITQKMAPRLSNAEMASAHTAMAQLERRQGNVEATMAQLDKVASFDPQAHQPHIWRVELLLEGDKLEDATAALKAASERFGTQWRGGRLQAWLSVLQGRPSQALEQLSVGMADDDTAANILKGHTLIILQRYKEAEEAYNTAGDDSEAKHDLTMVRAILGRDDALRELRTMAKTKDSALAQWRLGRALLERGKQKDAIEPLRRAVSLDPNGVFRLRMPPSLDLCRAYLSIGQPDRASQSCERARQHRPANMASYELLGQIALKNNDYKQALSIWQSASQQRPEDTRVLTELAYAQIMLGQFKEANNNLNKLLQSNPDSLQVLYLQGLNEFRAHRYKRALGYFERVLKGQHSARSAEAHYLSAWCHLNLRRPSNARKHLDAILKDPTWGARARLSFGEYHRQRGDWNRAISMAQKGFGALQRQDPSEDDLAMGHTILARIYELRHGLQHPDVVRELDNATRYNHAPAFYHKARVARSFRQRGSTLKHLKKAVELDAHYCPAVKLLRNEAKRSRRKITLPDTCK